MSDDTQPPSAPGDSPNELLDELDSLKELLEEEAGEIGHYGSVEEIASVEEYMRLKHLAETEGLGLEEYLQRQAEKSEELQDDASPHVDTEGEYGDGWSLAEAEDASATVDAYFAAVTADRRRQAGTQHNEETANDEADLVPVLDEVVSEESQAWTETITGDEEQVPVLDEVIPPEEADGGIPLLEEVVDAEATTPAAEQHAQATAVAGRPDESLDLDEMAELVQLIVERKLQRLRPELEKEAMEELKRLLPIAAVHRD